MSFYAVEDAAVETTTTSVLSREYLRYIQQVDGLAVSTIKNRQYILQAFIAYLTEIGIYSVREIDIEHVDSYLLHRRENDNLKISSMNIEKQTIRLFLAYCKNYKKLDLCFDYMLIRRSKERPPRIQTFSYDDIRRVLKHCDNDQDKLIIALLYETGMRIGELAGLNVKDIHETEIYVRGKGEKERPIFVSKELHQQIRKHVLKYRIISGNLIRHQQIHSNLPDTAMGVCRIRERLQNQFKKAGFDKMNPHQLRHSFAIRWLRANGDLRSLQKLLGHSNLDTTMRYLQVTDTHLAEAYNSVMAQSVWQ